MSDDALTIRVLRTDVLAALQPDIDDLVARRLVDALERLEIRACSQAILLSDSIAKVTRAVARLEKSHASRDEPAAIAGVIQAAKQLSRTDAAFRPKGR